jgi:hypothetical protein
VDFFREEWVLDYRSYTKILLRSYLIFGVVTTIRGTHYSAVSNLIFIKDKHEKIMKNFEGMRKDVWQALV